MLKLLVEAGRIEHVRESSKIVLRMLARWEAYA